jgi:hypothetical protein
VKYWCAALLVLLVACPSVHAVAMSGLSQLYETYAWSTYPDIAMLQQPDAQRMMFPDHTADQHLAVEYGEIENYGFGVLGVLTCTSDRDGYVSMIHYSADGFSRIIHHQLPVYAKHRLTLSGMLPANTDGVTLLLFWNELPDTISLAVLARTPNAISAPITGVRESHWRRRQQPKLYADPWRDRFRPARLLPAFYANAGWPWCSARLTSFSEVVVKDCAVEFNGQTDWSMDEYGTYGQWRLDWGSELTISAELPVSESWISVDLLIYSGESAERVLDLSALELEINGWPVTPHYATEISFPDVQPVAISLSQYVHAGSNRITLGVSSLASHEWPIDGIEIWVY